MAHLDGYWVVHDFAARTWVAWIVVFGPACKPVVTLATGYNIAVYQMEPGHAEAQQACLGQLDNYVLEESSYTYSHWNSGPG